jgi:serine protease Do
LRCIPKDTLLLITQREEEIVDQVIPVSGDLITDAVENISKSTVNIASVRMVQDQLFRVFPIEGVRSGVIIDENGYILTNNM